MPHALHQKSGGGLWFGGGGALGLVWTVGGGIKIGGGGSWVSLVSGGNSVSIQLWRERNC